MKKINSKDLKKEFLELAFFLQNSDFKNSLVKIKFNNKGEISGINIANDKKINLKDISLDTY